MEVVEKIRYGGTRNDISEQSLIQAVYHEEKLHVCTWLEELHHALSSNFITANKLYPQWPLPQQCKRFQRTDQVFHLFSKLLCHYLEESDKTLVANQR